MGKLSDYENSVGLTEEKKQQSWGQYLDESIRDAITSGADTGTFGLLPWIADEANKILNPTEQGVAAKTVATARERSPTASTVGDIAGLAVPGAGVAGGVARGGLKLGGTGARMLAGRGLLGGTIREGVAGGVTEGLNELKNSIREDRDYDLTQPIKGAGFGGAAGGVTGAASQLFGKATPIAERLGYSGKPVHLPTEAPLPTGGGVKLTGPEAMQRTGMPGARDAQTLLQNVSKRAPGASADNPILQATGGPRESQLNAVQDLMTQRILGAEAKVAKRGEDVATRLPNLARNVPGAKEAWQTVKTGAAPIKEAADSIAGIEARLAQMRKVHAANPLPATEDAIAKLEQRLHTAAPVRGAAAQARTGGEAFDAFRASLPVEGLPTPDQGGVGGLLRAATAYLSPKLALGMEGANLARGQGPVLNPKGVLATLANPADLAKALSPEDLKELLLRSLALQGGRAGAQHANEAVMGGKNQPLEGF